MSLVHTLLFMVTENQIQEGLSLAAKCFKSLSKSTYKTLVIYNQGCLSEEALKTFASMSQLDCHIIGNGVNVGTTIGRQKCFEYIWTHLPDTKYISELHLDMIFPPHWEDEMVKYLDENDEPLISCGIIDKYGRMPFLNESAPLPSAFADYDQFLEGLKKDKVIPGFTNPCIHVSSILRETGGYNPIFLKGRQCFEDDSMLLGYYYYYGIRHAWKPKINFNTVVYHAVAGQRLALKDSTRVNFEGLVCQYGVMGLKALGFLHTSPWHKQYFLKQYHENIAAAGKR